MVAQFSTGILAHFSISIYTLIKYLGRRALLNVIIIINIYSFNLGAYKKMLIIHTLEQIKYFIIYHT